jgi:hydroxyacylglutathione hydrolase
VSPRIDRVVTSGQFCLDGGCWDVDNNIWLIGDDTEVLVVDAAQTAEPIIDAVSDRKLVAVLCTHAPLGGLFSARRRSANYRRG